MVLQSGELLQHHALWSEMRQEGAFRTRRDGIIIIGISGYGRIEKMPQIEFKHEENEDD